MTDKGEIQFAVPNEFLDKRGRDPGILPFRHEDYSLPARYQQVFSASQFKDLGKGAFLYHVADRPFCTGIYGFVISDFVLSFSTTSAKPDQLSRTFSENRGVDFVEAHREAALGIRGIGGASFICNEPPAFVPTWKEFATFNGFNTPFFYDPSKGNLLMEFTFTSENPWSDIKFFTRDRDAVAVQGDSVSSQAAFSLDKPDADAVSTTGLIFFFRALPIPELEVSHLTNTVVIAWKTTVSNFRFQSSVSPSNAASWSDYNGTIDTSGYSSNILKSRVFLPDASLTKATFFRLYWNTPQPGVPSPKVRIVSPSELEPPQ